MKKYLSFIVLLSLITGAALAQDQTGMIFGNVTTEDGAIINGASVRAESSALIRPYETVTNTRGRYVFPILPIGAYRIVVKADTYQTTALEDIQVSVNSRLRIDLVVKAGVVGQEIVTITGEAPMVDITKTDTGMTISKDLFKTLPKGRDFSSVVALAPGASNEGEHFGGIMVDGATSSENTFVMDGASINHITDGDQAQNAVFEFVEEVQVRSGGYNAEYGGSMGGVINVVTRSGGNEFSGSLVGYYNGDWMDGNPRPTLRLDPYADDNRAEYFENSKDDYNRYDVGASLGGYIIKDRIWFFASYMPYFKRTERDVDYRNPDGTVSETESYYYEQQRQYLNGKITVQITDRWNASISGSSDYYKTSNPLPSRQGQTHPADNWEDIYYKYPGYVISGRTDYFVTDDFYLSATVGYHTTDEEREGFELPTVARYRFGLSDYGYNGNEHWANQIPAQYVHGPNWSNITYADIFAFDHDLREQVSSTYTASYFTNLGGDHQFKVGGQTFWVHHDISDGVAAQYYNFYWREPGNTDNLYSNQIDGSENLTGKYGFYRVQSFDTAYGSVADTRSYRYAAFIQDTWSPNDRLTFNVGVRAESEKLPSYNTEYPDPFEWGFEDKLAPRFGVSWDVTGEGKLRVYANFGVYYDVMKLDLAQSQFGGTNWEDAYYTLDTLEWWTFPNAIDPGQYPGKPLGTQPIDHRIPSYETTDADTKPMGIFEYIVGGDWQFSQDMTVYVRFVHKNLRRAIEDVGIITSAGEKYYVGNPGFGLPKRIYEENGYPAPEAIRDYYGLDVRLLKRFSDNWTGGINLTFSRLRGNYAGLAQTDEDDRQDPNRGRSFDAWYQQFDAFWNETIGVLPSDRRWTSTIFGSYMFNEGMLEGLVIGIQQAFNDGTPRTTELALNNQQGYYPYGRGDLGRHDVFTQTDIYAEYNMKLNDRFMLNLNINVVNLFDQDGEISRYRLISNSAAIPHEELLQMYNSRTVLPINDRIDEGSGLDPRFGWTNRFQNARSIRVGAKISF